MVFLARAHLVDGGTALLGVLVAIFATFQANDPAPRARKITAALLALPAAFAVSVTALLSAIHPVAGAVGFLALAFAGVWVRRYGPRGFGLGMMAIVTAFYALFLQLHPVQLPAALVAIVLGTLAAWITLFLILPDSPHLALASARAGFEARLGLIEAATERARADVTSAADDALRAHLVELDAAAVTIDGLVAGDAFVLDARRRSAIRIALLEAEVATAENVRARTAQPSAATGVAPSALRARVQATLQEAIDAPFGGADAPISSGAKPPDIGGMKPATRQAFQLTTASALAMVLGTAIPPHQYAWALLTAFIVYAGSASAAEARRRAFARTIGTAAGVGVALVAMELVKQHTPLEFALAFVGLFIAMYVFRMSYIAFTFFVTITIAMIYDVVGRPTDELLMARLIETIVGTVCGALAATVVVPLKTNAVVGTLGHGLAQAFGRDGARDSIDQTLDDTRDRDAKLQEFLTRARPLLEPVGGAGADALDAQASLIDCGGRARAFALERCRRGVQLPRDVHISESARRLESLFANGANAALDWHAIAISLNEIAAGYIASMPHEPAAVTYVYPTSTRPAFFARTLSSP